MTAFEWVAKELAEYPEPERKGTTKGELIGFSRYKQEAALLTAIGLSVSEIRRRVKGINYNSLVSWRSREDFIERVALLRNKYLQQNLFEDDFVLFKAVLYSGRPEVAKEVIKWLGQQMIKA